MVPLRYLAVSALGLVNLIVGVIVENTTTDGKKEVAGSAERAHSYYEVSRHRHSSFCMLGGRN